MKFKPGKIQEVVLESDASALNEVEEIIEDIHQKLKFREDVFGNIMIAVTEAVNNAIQHGNKSNTNKKVFVSFDMPNDFKFIVSVKDEGDGFDPTALPDPTAPENIDKPGGRGVFLMQNLAEELRFSNNGREVSMIFYI